MKLAVRATVGFVLVVLALAGMVWAASAAYDDAREETITVRNESITADVGNWTSVASHECVVSYADDEVIYNSSDTQLVEDTDYLWNTTNSSVKWINTLNVSDGELMAITYNYTAKVDSACTIKTTTDAAFPAIILVMFLALATVVVAFAAEVWGLVGGNGTGRKIGR